MYSASLAQASAQGIMLSVLIVAVGLGVYFILSRRAEILGAGVVDAYAAVNANPQSSGGLIDFLRRLFS